MHDYSQIARARRAAAVEALTRTQNNLFIERRRARP